MCCNQAVSHKPAGEAMAHPGFCHHPLLTQAADTGLPSTLICGHQGIFEGRRVNVSNAAETSR
jgi:hypothetical protein